MGTSSAWEALRALKVEVFGPLEGLRVALSHSELVVVTTFVLIVVCLFQARRSVVAALALFPLAALWLLVNQVVEGPTLLAISWSHGVTFADLLSFAAVVVGGWSLLQRFGNRPRASV